MATEKLALKAKIVITLVVFAAFIFEDVYAQKMRMEDLQAITFFEDKMAASRRYSQPIPQLVCVGGNAGCHAYTPKVVQCSNKGWDGISIQWECKADMPEKYSFGTISVVCEGYEDPEDPYILKGSCSLEYALEYSDKEHHSTGKRTYYKKNDTNQNGNQWSAVPVVIGLVVFGYIIYSKFLSGNTGSRNYDRSRGPDIGWNVPHSNFKENTHEDFSAPPPYRSGRSTYNQYDFQDYQASQGLGGGGGFWTGLGTGGLLGYLFGSNRAQAPKPSTTYSKFSRHTNDDDEGSLTSARTATAYGGTKRR